MRIIIVGNGKVGSTMTEKLSKEGHDIVVIDNKLDVLQKSIELYDVMGVQGNGASLKTQIEADVSTADLMIAVTPKDEVNLLCCIIAKKLGIKHTIARVRNPEYAEQLIFLRDELGLSMTINPERAAATEIYRLLQFPSLIKRHSFLRGRVEMIELPIEKDSILKDCQLSDLPDILEVKILVCVVERDGQVYIPAGDFRLKEGDNIFVTAETKNLTLLIQHMGLVQHIVKNVIIIGGSHIAYYLTQELLNSKIHVKIIEQNFETCQNLADKLTKATVIHGDGSQRSLLTQEGIKYADAVITLTNIDEENLIISMYAHHLGVHKTITKMNRMEYKDVFRGIGIDSTVSPKLLTANAIIRYVRAMQTTEDSSIITLHKIADDKAEALEFRVTKNTHYLEVPLLNITLKKNILIACIRRGNVFIIPKGSDYLKVNDYVVVVTTAEQVIKDLNDIFQTQY